MSLSHPAHHARRIPVLLGGILSLAVMFSGPSRSWGQVVIQTGGGVGAGGAAWSGQSYYSLPGYYMLAQEQVRKEIELVPHQEEELQQVAKEFQKRWQETFAVQVPRDLSPEERAKVVKESQDKMKTLQEDATRKVKEILLPHQIKVLEMVELRMRVGALLQYGPALERVGLSDAQKDQIKKNRSELADKLYDLQRQSFEDVLKILTPEQLEKLKQPLNLAQPGAAIQGKP